MAVDWKRRPIAHEPSREMRIVRRRKGRGRQDFLDAGGKISMAWRSSEPLCHRKGQCQAISTVTSCPVARNAQRRSRGNVWDSPRRPISYCCHGCTGDNTHNPAVTVSRSEQLEADLHVHLHGDGLAASRRGSEYPLPDSINRCRLQSGI